MYVTFNLSGTAYEMRESLNETADNLYDVLDEWWAEKEYDDNRRKYA
jgi:hypothetical protein